MNRALLAHTWRANRLRLVVVTVALALWGMLMPIIFDAFGTQFQEIMDSGAFPTQLTQFGGGDIFSLTGSVALGFVHPIAVGLNLVFAVGFAATAVAGERQRGTLEVLLSRPLSRRVVYATLGFAGAAFIGITVAGLTFGAWLGSAITGRTAELGVEQPAAPVAQRGVAVLGARVDRPARVGLVRPRQPGDQPVACGRPGLIFPRRARLVWPDAKGLQPFSLFHYVDPKTILAGFPARGDYVLLAAVTAAAAVAALVIFPRRDLAAPS